MENSKRSSRYKDLRMLMCQDTHTHTQRYKQNYFLFSPYHTHPPTDPHTDRERAVLILLSPGCWVCACTRVYVCLCTCVCVCACARCIKGIKALAQLRYHQPSTLLVRFGLSRLPHCLFCSAMWKMLNINNGFQWCIVEFLYELILPQWKRPRAWTKRLEPQHS